jgi:putative hemolysin
MVNLSDSAKTIRATIAKSLHSRLPVYETDPDQVLGIVQAKDLLHSYMSTRRLDVRNVIRPAPMIPDSVDARDVVSILKASPVHIGLVVDEYGHYIGVVTSADILESIVGEFRTEEGPKEAPVVRRGDGSLLISGDMPADEFREYTGIPLPEDRPTPSLVLYSKGLESYQGWATASTVMAGALRLDLDGRRIDKVLATKFPATRRGPQQVGH